MRVMIIGIERHHIVHAQNSGSLPIHCVLWLAWSVNHKKLFIENEALVYISIIDFVRAMWLTVAHIRTATY